MNKLVSGAAILLLLTLANATARAQDKDKKEDEKSKPTTTIDAWRNAMPGVAVEEGATVPSTPEAISFSENVETPEQIETKIRGLEITLMDALRGRNSKILGELLAEDFLLAGINIPGTNSDKTRYINWASAQLELKAYNFDRMIVKVFPTSAFVTYTYQRQANIGGVAADGEFVVTDVWGKHGDQWLVLSHHIGPSPKL